MKTKLYLLALLLALVPGAWAADVNITNIPAAATIPAGSYALGTTGQITRLLSVELLQAPGSNYTQQVGQNNTNYTLIIGDNGSNNVMVASNNLNTAIATKQHGTANLTNWSAEASSISGKAAGHGLGWSGTAWTNGPQASGSLSQTNDYLVRANAAGTNGILLVTNVATGLITTHFSGTDVTMGTVSATTLSFTNRSGADSNQVAVLDVNTNLVHSTTLYQPTNAGSSGKVLTATSATTTAFSDPAAASTVAAGATINAADGNALTNLAYIVKTNHTGNGTIAQGLVTITNVTGNITLGGFSGLVNGHENFAAVLVIPDGSTRTITMAAGVASTDGATDYYATNAQRLKLQFSIIPGVWTNVAAIHSR